MAADPLAALHALYLCVVLSVDPAAATTPRIQLARTLSTTTTNVMQTQIE